MILSGSGSGGNGGNGGSGNSSSGGGSSNGSSDSSDEPAPQVLGDQVSVVPTGGIAAGVGGGTNANPIAALMAFVLLAGLWIGARRLYRVIT
ncbi:MAG: hypothetical protein R3B69_00220 [Candidatus Paceibacterota bacterium]